MKGSLVVISLVPACFLISISLWFVSFGFLAGYLSLLTLIPGYVVWLRRKSGKTMLLLPLGWLIINLALAKHTVSEYDEKRDQYYSKVRRGEDLDFLEKSNVYGLNVAMAMAALPFYQEASLESIFLLMPSGNGTRYFRNGFFLESKKVREILAEGPLNANRRVRWSLGDYEFGAQEAGFALALNPCELSWDPSDSTFRAKVRVEYPMSSEVTLMRTPFVITVEEGLFGYLQKVGWLHPYDAVWSGKSGSGRDGKTRMGVSE